MERSGNVMSLHRHKIPREQWKGWTVRRVELGGLKARVYSVGASEGVGEKSNMDMAKEGMLAYLSPPPT
jgi:hypothetical protein